MSARFIVGLVTVCILAAVCSFIGTGLTYQDGFLP